MVFVLAVPELVTETEIVIVEVVELKIETEATSRIPEFGVTETPIPVVLYSQPMGAVKTIWLKLVVKSFLPDEPLASRTITLPKEVYTGEAALAALSAVIFNNVGRLAFPPTTSEASSVNSVVAINPDVSPVAVRTKWTPK